MAVLDAGAAVRACLAAAEFELFGDEHLEAAARARAEVAPVLHGMSRRREIYFVKSFAASLVLSTALSIFSPAFSAGPFFSGHALVASATDDSAKRIAMLRMIFMSPLCWTSPVNGGPTAARFAAASPQAWPAPGFRTGNACRREPAP
jgi:hypothetical protein